MSYKAASVRFSPIKPVPRRGWLGYFVAACGVGLGAVQAQEQVLLDYWWVMPREEVQNAPRVIRVTGAKGERYEEVYAEEQLAALRSSPVIMQARLERQAALRLEALQRARELREAGKSATVAYEEAWAEVYSRRWLNADWGAGGSKLEDMLNRLAAENEDLALTEEEQQWVLEALLEDDDRLDGEQGRALLANLSRRLRSMGYGRLYAPHAIQDELMERFAEAMRHGKESMAAYRDALFKTHRDRIMHHELRGYVAPWGMGAGGTRSYRQAPLELVTTTATANTPPQGAALTVITAGPQYAAPGLNTLPGAQTEFAVTAPAAGTSSQEDEEEEEKSGEQGENEVVATSAPSPVMMRSRGFSLRAASPVMVLSEEPVSLAAADVTVGSGSVASIHQAPALTPDAGSWLAPARWGTVTKERKGLFNTYTANFATWVAGTKLAACPGSIALAGGDLYLGSGYTGSIIVEDSGTLHAESIVSESRTVVIYNLTANVARAGSGEFRYGSLSGSGNLTLSNNAESGNAVIYVFNDAVADAWFNGTVAFGASQGGITELDLGVYGKTTAWQDTVFDLTPIVTSAYGTASSQLLPTTILNIRNDVAIAGLDGGGATSTVTSQSGSLSYTLTLGDELGKDYTYSGSLNGRYYTTATSSSASVAPFNLTKVGENTQTFTQDVTGNNALNIVTVDGTGTLAFSQGLEAAKVHANNGVLTAASLTVSGGESTGSDTVALQIQNGAKVNVSGTTTAYNANVSSGGSLNSRNLEVSHILHADGADSSVVVGSELQPGTLNLEHLYVSHTAKVKVWGGLTASSGVDVGYATSAGSSESLLKVTGALDTPVLRLRSDGHLITGSSVYVGSEAFVHGGAIWELTGTNNTIDSGATMHLEDAGSAVLTLVSTGGGSLSLPGTLGLYRSGWAWNEETKTTNALMHLDGVTLDFSKGVQLVNTGLALKEGVVLTLATTANGGAYQGNSVMVWGQDSSAWHAYLDMRNDNTVILKIDHKLEHPYTVGDDGLVYIEMYQDASDPALPYVAYTGASYNKSASFENGSWSGEEVVASELFKFNNLQVTEGGRVYMGEDVKSGVARADRHFGGNVEVVSAEGSAAAELHGQIGTWGNWLMDGYLSGSGDLRLVAHNDNTGDKEDDESFSDNRADDGTGTETTVVTKVYGTASTFTFTDVENPQLDEKSWLAGTLSMANPAGGIVQLNVGNVNIAGQGDTRWNDVVVDLTCSSYQDHANASGKKGSAAELVLGVSGNATLAGLVGGEESSVVSNVRVNSMLPTPTLTVGDNSGTWHDFGGTIGSGRYYTGGQAYMEETTEVTYSLGIGGELVSSTTMATRHQNYIPIAAGSLNLDKVAGNVQKFSGSAYLDQVRVLGGELWFTGSADIRSMTVASGATLQTGANVSMGSLSLYGGSTWEIDGSSLDCYLLPLYLTEMGDGVNITSTGNSLEWKPARYMNLSGANLSVAGNILTAGGSDAVFMLGSGVSLNLGDPYVLTNLDNVGEGCRIALYGNVASAPSLPEDMVLVEDSRGRFYDASYTYDSGKDTIYLELGKERHYGIVVAQPGSDSELTIESYYWSGVGTPTTDNDVHHLMLNMHNVWRADGSADGTGWHEQRAEGSSNDDIGVYENGFTTYFTDYNVHYYVDEHRDDDLSVYATERKVDIKGDVAPGTIYVTAENNAGRNGSSEAQMEFAYAFVSTDGTGCITDVSSSRPTSIIKSGEGLLLLNLSNTFSGGIDVQDGGLYLAAVGAAGTGTLRFHTDQQWSYNVMDNSISNAVDYRMNRTGAELMICYPHSDDALSGFRGSSITNDIVLTSTAESDVEGNFKISFAHASFNEKSTGDDHANVPRHWRNLNLTGALVGAGYTDASGNWVNTSGNDTIELTGYCSTWANVRDQSYVSSITLSEDNAKDSYIKVTDPVTQRVSILNRFAGKVKLLNTVNTSPLDSNKVSKRIAGTVQVVLKGDKLSEAELDMSRESVTQTDWDGFNANPRQTYNNILVINGDATLRGLSADFKGSGYYFPESNANSGSVTRSYVGNMAQCSEVWHVRTVSTGLNTLYLGEWGEKDGTTYVYSGAMGFAQAYAGTSQAHVPWGDGFLHHVEEGWYFSGHSMGAELLSLTKSGSSTQYVHTARLQDLSVYEGTLGFNNLDLKGNLNLVGKSHFHLGVSSDAGWDASHNQKTTLTGYERYELSNTATVHAGKTLTVITMGADAVTGAPDTAWVQGNLTMEEGAALTFRLNNVLPYSAPANQSTKAVEESIVTLMDVDGTLSLPEAGNIGVTMTGVDFSTTSIDNKRYYLAAADEVLVGSGNETSFVPRTITLGYGYFGTLYMVGTAGSSLDGDAVDGAGGTDRDYLVMTVNGDPRRTWSGMMCQTNVDAQKTYITEENSPNYTWNSTTPAGAFDYRWKENQSFENGQVVLFGNLYQPTKWVWNETLPESVDTVKVGAPLHAGTLVQDTKENTEYDFNIDGHSVESRTGAKAFQAVKVDGRVAPFSLILNSDYWLYEDGQTPDKSTGDSTNYYFFSTGNGAIHNASQLELSSRGFDPGWFTMLHKAGDGVVVMELDNRYTGGTVLQGGRMVMKHVNALGFVYNTGAYATADPADDSDNLDDQYEQGVATGLPCSITLMNGAGLHADFDDDNFPGNYVEDGNVALGKAMDTTTIRNTVIVNVYADPTDSSYNTLIDGRLYNSYNKKLILKTLEGESDTVLELNGVGLGSGDKYRYGVFKVLNPGKFYGTVRMSGHVWGEALEAAGGMVQLDIMSTAKSGSGEDWLNATVDLTVADGTERTVVALDVMSSGEICELNSITGSILTNGGSSSVLNMSKHNAACLKLSGTRNGDYHGVLGYGDFQVAVNYGGYGEEEQGTTQHHYGAVGHGSLNLIKAGEGSTQSVRRAWLNQLEVQGGVFHVKEALVAHDITAGGGKRVMVGDMDMDSLYALTVGAGGTLAMNTTFAESGVKKDAWAALTGGTTQGDTDTWVAWVMLEDGATLSAREDWYTAKQVDIATGARVTINSHNFAIDPYIRKIVSNNPEDDPFGKYYHSHIIQLLGEITGRNVTLNVNNWLTNPDDPDARDAIDYSTESEYMGYVAIRDHNGFTGSSRVNVEAMTALQILASNDGVEADVDMTVRGRNATVQVVDGLTQYADKVVLGANSLEQPEHVSGHDPLHRENNGQVILGGQEVTTLVPNEADYRTEPDTAGAQMVVSARHDDTLLQVPAAGQQSANTMDASITHMHVDLTGTGVRIGGEEGHVSVATNAHVDVVDKSTTHAVHDTQYINSIVHLQEDCSVDIAEAVLVDYQSAVVGSNLQMEAPVVSPLTGPVAATGADPTSWTKEVNTSGSTIVQFTFAEDSPANVYTVGNANILVLQTEQFQGVDVTGNGLTIQLFEDMITMGYNYGAKYIALMVDGGSGRFLFEQDKTNFANLIDSEFVLQNQEGQNMEGYWITSSTVSAETGVASVSMHMLYFRVPEPATTTLSLLALTALCARRRRRA